MADDFIKYLTDLDSKTKSADAEKNLDDWFMRPALTQLMSSQAYMGRDWPNLRKLARDLLDHNTATIELATKHPDVFHHNIIRSRRSENRVHAEVIDRLDKLISQAR